VDQGSTVTERIADKTFPQAFSPKGDFAIALGYVQLSVDKALRFSHRGSYRRGMEAAMGLRDRKKAATRAAIEKAAVRLFRLRGFEATTAEDIAAAARVSRSTLFRYFETKESMFFGPQRRRVQRFEALLQGGGEHEPPMVAIRRACVTMSAEFMDDPEQVLAEYEIVHSVRRLVEHEALIEREWEALMCAWLARASEFDPVEAALIAGAIFGMVRAGQSAWIETGCAGDLGTITERVFELVDAMKPGAASIGANSGAFSVNAH